MDASPKSTYQSAVEEDNDDERVSTSRTTFLHETSTTEMPEGSVVGYDSWQQDADIGKQISCNYEKANVKTQLIKYKYY